jgi:hypothetical protein
MNFDNDFSFAVGRDLDRLDMRIDDRPLTFPIAAHLITPVDVATFHSICPNDIGMHGRENALDLAAVEKGIHSSEQFLIIRHSVSPLSFPAAIERPVRQE